MGEFPTDWHRDRYIEDVAREVEGAKRRLAELATLDSPAVVLTDAEGMLENAEAELARVTGDAPKAKKAAAKKQG